MAEFAFIGNDYIASRFLGKTTGNAHFKYVVTNTDRPKGRGRRMSETPVAEYARHAGIETLKTDEPCSEDFMEILRENPADFFLVFSYGHILSEAFLSIPGKMPVNIHPSLLPEYRGAAPINRVIMNGEEKTGVSFIKMVKKMDAGPIIMQEILDIEPDMTSGDLTEKIIERAVDMFRQYDWESPAALRQQDDEAATYAPKIKRDELAYCTHWDCKTLNNMINGLSEYGIRAYLGERRIKLFSSRLNENSTMRTPGLIEISGSRIVLYARKGSVNLEIMQLDGERKMNAADFINGRKIKGGDIICAEYSQ
ncbi:MAG: methionyl-tRNA formyltransferase [candidate division WOR-3 bacterium]|nr:methionyl-tRNA formyltransferase [candidate division WOR-3 bacterium]